MVPTKGHSKEVKQVDNLCVVDPTELIMGLAGLLGLWILMRLEEREENLLPDHLYLSAQF